MPPTAPSILPPGALFVPPPGGAPAANLLVALHGAGDAPPPYARLATQLALPATAGLALAGLEGLAGGRAWFRALDPESFEPTPPGVAAASLDAALPIVAAWIDGAGWERGRVHLFGFGDGGTVCLHLAAAAAAAGAAPYGSCVSVSAGMLEGAGPAPAAHPAEETAALPTRGAPTLVTRGAADPDFTADAAASAVARLRGVGCGATCFEVPGKAGGMLDGPVEVRQCMLLWARTLKAAPPAGTVEVEGGVGTEEL
jgi:predicted esterase